MQRYYTEHDKYQDLLIHGHSNSKSSQGTQPAHDTDGQGSSQKSQPQDALHDARNETALKDPLGQSQ
ncbi:hypothetical protein MMC34_007865, partial [Xylographa carneopallida]|nr:hypothetical protein [Xylographa carneopallida]